MQAKANGVKYFSVGRKSADTVVSQEYLIIAGSAKACVVCLGVVVLITPQRKSALRVLSSGRPRASSTKGVPTSSFDAASN